MAETQKGFFGKLTSSATSPKPGTVGHWFVRQGGRLNTIGYRLSRGRLGGTFDGAPVVLVHHVGAKSGEARVAPLLYLADGEDFIIVASYGGAPKSPAWFHNLKANPDTKIELRGETIRVHATVIPEPERTEIWPRLVDMYAAYADYQAKTERVIPLVRLTPIR
jgi:deazaflavin-dependent oxidoreductase (nitroreductase family)